MVEHLDIARKYGVVGEEEASLLESPKRPIVLLKKIEGTLPEAVAPFNPNFGIMLPSAPLHHLLLETYELSVLIMTSANISGYPIIFENEKALRKISKVADYFLMNNRDIHTYVDDSLVRHSVSLSGEGFITFLRRSKGYAPFPVTLKTELSSIIALGAELKNVVAISKGKDVYLSQHIGDLKNDEVYDSMVQCSRKMQDLFDISPEAVAIDMHPQFRTASFFNELDKPVFKIQHHHAHMASCMAENNLNKPVIGAIFDGTGYGTDKTIWGGEFLIGDYKYFNRAGHIYPFYLLGGDKAVVEPIRTAISLLYTAYGEEAEYLELPLFESLSHEEKNVFLKMAEKKINSFKTTSMGRLFDGVSSLIGICHRIEYEAQAAIELEGLLNKDLTGSSPLDYSIINDNGKYILDHRPTIRHLVQLILKESKSSELSRMFHSTIVKASAEICKNISKDTGIIDVVVSGGVFMNEYILCNIITEFRKKGLKIHYQQTIPSNDGGIALGQLMIANEQMKILNVKKALDTSNDENDAVKHYLNNVESNARTYSRVFDKVFVSGKGSILKDIDGTSYIDCLSGAGTLAIGHNHPDVISKLKETLETNQVLHALDLMTPVREKYIRKIFNCLPYDFKNQAKIQFCGPTGADAVEASIKLFKIATNRRTVIAFYGAYHGMTAGSLSLTGNLNAKNDVPALMPDVHFLPYPYQYRCPYGVGGDETINVSLRHIRQVLTDPESGITKPAAIFLEAIQGEGGCIPASIRWLMGVRKITSDLDIPLIIDEIQTGFGRTGAMFAFESAGIIPDAVLLSKAVGGGLPISMLVYRDVYDKWVPGAHAGTFRGNQLAMVAGIETIDIIHRERLVEQSKLKGEVVMNRLNELKKKYSCIGDVRGKGLLIGIEIIDINGMADEFGVKPADSKRAYNIKKECFKRGLIIESGGRFGSVLRLLPALNISQNILMEAVDILSHAIEATENI